MPKFRCVACDSWVQFAREEPNVSCRFCQTEFTIKPHTNDAGISVMVKKEQPVLENQLLTYTPPTPVKTVKKVPLQSLPQARKSGLLPSWSEKILGRVQNLGQTVRLTAQNIFQAPAVRIVGMTFVVLFVLLGGYAIYNRTNVMRAANSVPVTVERTKAVSWSQVQEVYEQRMEYRFTVGMSSDKMMNAQGTSLDSLSSIQYVGHVDSYSFASLTMVDPFRFGEKSLVQPLLMTFLGSLLQEWENGPAWINEQMKSLQSQSLVASTTYKDAQITLQIDRGLGLATLILQKK